MNEKKRLLKNTGLIAIGNLGAKATSFILLPLYTSILSTGEFGTYDFIVALNAFLLPVITVCMHEAMFRFIIERGDDKNEFASIVSHAFFVIILGIILLTFGTIGVNIIFPIRYSSSFLAYMIANTLYVFAVNLLRGMGKMKKFAIISSGRNIMQVALNVVAVAVLKLGVNGLILSAFITEVLAFLVTAYECKLWNYVKIRYLSRNTFKEMILYALPLIPNSVCAQIINISDRLIISFTIGTSSNGIYSVSYKFPNVIETAYHFFYTAWSESAARVFEKGKQEAEKYYISLYKMIDNAIFSVVLLMTAGMPILFRIFVRGDYVQGFIYVPMLMFAMYFDCIGKFYSGIFTALKQTKIMAWSTLWAAIVNIVVNIALIMKIGLHAAAFSTLMADIVLVVIRKRMLEKSINFKFDNKKLFVEVLFALIIVGLYSYDNYIQIAISICVALGYTVTVNRQLLKSMCKVVCTRLNVKRCR